MTAGTLSKIHYPRTEDSQEPFPLLDDTIFWEADAQTFELLYVSPRVKNLLGYELGPDPVTVNQWIQFIWVEDRASFMELCRAVAADGQCRRLEHRLVNRDGQEDWFHSEVHRLSQGEGRKPVLACLMIDLSRLKRDYQQKESSLLQTTLDATEDGILVVDRHGRIVNYNQRFSRLWRIPGAILKSWSDSSALDFVVNQLKDPFQFLSKVQELVDRPEAESFDTLTFKDGRVFERFSVPQRFQGKIIGRVWSFRDVTEKYRVERRLQLISDISRQLAFSLDVETTLKSIARICVPSFADACAVYVVREGVDRIVPIAIEHIDPEKVNLTWSYFGNDVLPRSGSTDIAKCLRTGESKLYEVVSPGQLDNQVSNAKQRDALRIFDIRSMILVPMFARERPIGVLLFYQSESGRRYDRDDLMLAEEIARRSALAVDNAVLYQKAQQAVRDQQDILAIVSHDLKNPLSAILLSVEHLSRSSPCVKAGDPFSGKLLGNIQNMVQRMSRLIGDLLQASKIQAGKLSVDLAAQQPMGILQEAKEMMQLVADPHSVRIEVQMQDGLPLVVCDRERILQVLSNIVGNAIKFSPRGSTVKIAAQPIQGGVLFSVSDEGPGIPESQVDKIFERYWRSKSSENPGAGLGLFIAKGIIEGHGGRIWARSLPGNGTTIYFSLVALQKDAPQRQDAA